jgi:hypothetical protein
MTLADDRVELIHATCVVVKGMGVLLRGPSGAGKSDLALRLIDRGATLIGDDYVQARGTNGQLQVRVPETIAGLIEVRASACAPCRIGRGDGRAGHRSGRGGPHARMGPEPDRGRFPACVSPRSPPRLSAIKVELLVTHIKERL